MAESQKETSSVDPKDKKSFLDEEIGKDFLSSWKAISVMDGDAMDINFDTVQSGKKKTFKFDNLDMDFNLDSDFDKLSSFKVDMTDLDFSGPPKKSAKPKERSETETSGENRSVKQDQFSFSFDFDDLDAFNFNTSSMTAEKSSKKKLDSEGAALDISDCQGSKIQPVGAGMVDVPATAKPLASDNKDTPNAENMVGSLGACNSINDTCLSKSTISGDLAVQHGHNIATEKKVSTSTEETGQQCPLPEKAMLTEPCTQQAIQNLPVQSVGRNEPIRVTISDMPTDVCSPNTDVDTTSGGKSKAEMIAGLRSKRENSEQKETPSLCIAKSESKEGERKKPASNAPMENVDETEPAKNDLEDTSTARLTGNAMDGTGANRDVFSSTPKLPVFPSASESLVGKLMLMKEEEGLVDKLMPVKEKEGDGIRSEFFKKTEESGHQLPQPSSAGVEDSSFGNKRFVPINSCPENEKRLRLNAVDAQVGSKFVGNTSSVSREPTKSESVLLGNENKVKNNHNIGENFKSDGVQSGRKLVAGSRPYDKDVKKGDSVVRGSEKSTNLQVNPSSLTEKTLKSSSQTSVKPRLAMSSMGSILNSKTVFGEGLKTGKRIPELSSLRNLRVTKANKDILNSALQKDSLKILDQKVEVPAQTVLRISHPVGSSGKHTPPTLSLKRKTSEESNADLVSLKPLKRLSESPNESRNFKESSPKIVEKEACNHENKAMSKTKNGLYDHQSSRLEITREANMAEFEVLLVMENDGNVERAEAYTKELEDICNMLKKKHEEAKEILVRAVVNNNNLLMLNHPIYEEKIRMIQHFAARLMSKELPV